MKQELAILYVAIAHEYQRNPIFTAWFSISTPALFANRLTINLVGTISRSVVLKDCNFNFDLIYWKLRKSQVCKVSTKC